MTFPKPLRTYENASEYFMKRHLEFFQDRIDTDLYVNDTYLATVKEIKKEMIKRELKK